MSMIGSRSFTVRMRESLAWQEKNRIEVAEKVTNAREIGKGDRQVEVDRLIQLFVAFAKRGERAPKELVYQVVRQVELSSGLSDSECQRLLTKYLNLSGYSREGNEI